MKSQEKKERLLSLFFSYVSPLLRKGFERPITEKDLLHLPEGAEASAHEAGFLNMWSKNHSAGEAMPVARALNGVFAADRRRIAIVACIHIAFAVTTPVLLNQLFTALEGSRQFSQSESLWLAAGLFLSTLAYGLANEQIFHLPRVLALKVHGCVISAIGQSTARSASSKGHEPKDNGQIINLVTNDCWRLFELYVQRHRLWAVPIQIALLLPLLIYYLGPAALIGIVLLFAISPVSRLLIARIAVIRQELLGCSDSRLSLIKKALDHIRSIKLGYKEQQVIDRILVLRRRESQLLSSRIWLSTLLNLIVVGSGTLVAAVSIIVYTLLGNELTTSAVFTAIAMFNLLQMPVAQLSDVYRVHSESSKSLTRIDEFLAKANSSPQPTIDIWRDLGLPERGLITVASGTDQILDAEGFLSDLVASLMNEEDTTRATVASVGINDWLFHGTIRYNIILAKAFDQQRYEQVIDQVCLREDLETLAKGDQTVLSSNGANLSGGQRQRVNLARALYSQPKFLILNEPLRGLDEVVRARVLQHLLSPKISSVTNQCLIVASENSLDLRPYASHHLTVDKDKTKMEANELQRTFAPEANLPATRHDTKAAASLHSQLEQSELQVDKPRTGNIDPKVVRRYLGTIGFSGAALVLLFFTIKEAADLLGNFTLAAHSSTGKIEKDVLASFEFLPTYIAAIISVLAAIAMRSLLLGRFTLGASNSFFATTINRVFKAPPRYFWQNSLSVIMNRLAKDVDSLDQSLPQILSGLLLCLFTSLGIIVAIGVTTAEVLLLLVPLLLFYGYCQRYFSRTAREAKRLFASTRTPFLNALTELLDGGAIAKLYGSSEMLLSSYKASLDIHQKALHTMLIINRWLGSRLVVISGMLIGGLSFAAVSQSTAGESGWWGAAFAYSFSLTNVLTWGVQAMSDAEAEFSAVERLCDLSDSAESSRPRQAAEAEVGRVGLLKVEDFHFRFAKDQPKLFDGLELEIPSGQKLGIVGRTGSGKSTLVYALAGLLSAEQGQVSFGGQDMSSIDYNQLRRQVAVVPQEHEFMFGSVRQNIDPTGKASDLSILTILTELWGGPIDAKQLDVDVSELNTQQALAVALTAELIKAPKVLILDEVTALTDQQQDAALYHRIWSLARRPTLIVISHNLSGLALMDRIVVLSKGKITYDGAYHAGLADSLV